MNKSPVSPMRQDQLEDALRLVQLWMEGKYKPEGWIYPHGAREIRQMIKETLPSVT